MQFLHQFNDKSGNLAIQLLFNMAEKRYTRYTSKYQDSKENSSERKEFETRIIQSFNDLYQTTGGLKVHVGKSLFEDILNQIGVILQENAKKIISDPIKYSELNKILNDNPVPELADDILTPEFRIFCLQLNALKNWLSAEQASTDRVLLGGNYKSKLAKVIQNCLVTNERLNYLEKGAIDYHHPMRDGRCAIPLSKHGHSLIEGQVKKTQKK